MKIEVAKDEAKPERVTGKHKISGDKDDRTAVLAALRERAVSVLLKEKKPFQPPTTETAQGEIRERLRPLFAWLASADQSHPKEDGISLEGDSGQFSDLAIVLGQHDDSLPEWLAAYAEDRGRTFAAGNSEIERRFETAERAGKLAAQITAHLEKNPDPTPEPAETDAGSAAIEPEVVTQPN